MARATAPFCNVYYTFEFDAAIRGHHVYQSKWTPTLDMKLECEFDKRSEAAEYGENAIGVYVWGEEGKESGLVGHLPTELSKLLKQFLDADKKNMLIVTVIGKRKREVAQPARDVLGTSPEGPLKVLTSGTSRGPPGDLQGTLRGPTQKLMI